MKLVYKHYFPKGKAHLNIDPETGYLDRKKNMYFFEMNSVDIRRRSQMYPGQFADKEIVGLFDLFGAKKLIVKHFLDPITGKENGGYIELYK